MPDYRLMERQLSDALGLRRRPVAVTFRDAPPAGVTRFAGVEPSSCSFWRIAAGGQVSTRFRPITTTARSAPTPTT